MDLFIASAHRLLESKLELSPKRDDKIEAHEEHFDRMKEIEMVNKARLDAGRIPVKDHAASQYSRLEAEIWLIRAGGKPKSE